MTKPQWADQYGSQWYKHYDGKPPHDDDNDYSWDGFSWVKMDDDDLELGCESPFQFKSI